MVVVASMVWLIGIGAVLSVAWAAVVFAVSGLSHLFNSHVNHPYLLYFSLLRFPKVL